MNPDHTVEYHLRFPNPSTHLVEVQLRIPNAEMGKKLELWMAVWTPGSYLVREYSRHVEGVHAQTGSGAPIPVRKTAKNQWEVNGQLCEASFYIAKLNQARGNRKKAAKFFRKTLEYKITAYIEHAWAQVELERLKEK